MKKQQEKQLFFIASILIVLILAFVIYQKSSFSITQPIVCENKEYICTPQEFACFIRNIEEFSQATDNSVSTNDINSSSLSNSEIVSILQTACLNTIGTPKTGYYSPNWIMQYNDGYCILKSNSQTTVFGVKINNSLIIPTGSMWTGTPVYSNGFFVMGNDAIGLCYKNSFYGQPASQIETYECKYKQQCPRNTPTMTYDCVNNKCVGTLLQPPAPNAPMWQSFLADFWAWVLSWFGVV